MCEMARNCREIYDFYLITQANICTIEAGWAMLNDKWTGFPKCSARVDHACEFTSASVVVTSPP